MIRLFLRARTVSPLAINQLLADSIDSQIMKELTKITYMVDSNPPRFFLAFILHFPVFIPRKSQMFQMLGQCPCNRVWLGDWLKRLVNILFGPNTSSGYAGELSHM